MKKKTKARDRATPRPTRTAYTALRQIVQWIPEGLPDSVKCKIKCTLSEKREKVGMEARKPRDPESPKGFPGGLT